MLKRANDVRPGFGPGRAGIAPCRPWLLLGLWLALSSALPCPTRAAEGADAESAADAQTALAPPAMPVEVHLQSSVGDVRFPHNVHLKFGCVACHHQIHAAALETPHPDYMASSWVKCRTCHSTEPALPGPYYRCEACHHSEPENISDETLSAKVVVHRSCWKCHESGTGVEASKGCADCHVKGDRTSEGPNG